MNSSSCRPHSTGSSPKLSTTMETNPKEKMNLLPTKVSKNHLAIFQQNSKGWEGHPNAPSRWKGQSVMDWIGSLAAATEAGELGEGIGQGQVVVGGISLSDPSTVPHSVPWAMPTSNLKQPELADHRRRSLPHATPSWWDLRFLDQDVHPQASNYIRQISSLVMQVESLPGHSLANQHHDDYKLVQNRLVTIFRSIMNEATYDSEEEKRLALVVLYETTIEKLREIVQAATSGKPSPVKSLGKASQPTLRRKSTSVSISPQKKQDLSEYMTTWLRSNWTNPYPDENGLEQMARDCGTTSTIVSNWLINARTRKWRPAIVKASEMNRPSYMLLEDSLNIFDGKRVQSLSEDDDEGPNSKRIKRSYSSNV